MVRAVYVFFYAINARDPGVLAGDRNLSVFYKENLMVNFTGWIQSFLRIDIWKMN